MEHSDEEFVPEEETAKTSFGSSPDDLDESFSGTGPAALKKLREKLATAIKEKQEYIDGWQRSRADFANFRRDEIQRAQENEYRIKTEFAEAIIPALDSFEMAFKSESFSKASQEWRAGLSGLYSELLKSLSRFGIEQYAPVGEHFDPREHEAVREMQVEDREKDHTVISVERSGYRLGENIIRPAQVSVGTYTK